MIEWACGDCKNGHGKTVIHLESNGKGGIAGKEGATHVINDLDEVPQISFPIYGNEFMDKYMGMYEYIHLMDSPGVAFITIDDSDGKTEEHIMGSVVGCLPLFVMAMLMALLAGFGVWMFVSNKISQNQNN